MDFLNLIRGYHSILNRFNICLINLGKNFSSIENMGLLEMNKYCFSDYESTLPSEISEEELQNQEKKILHKIKK